MPKSHSEVKYYTITLTNCRIATLSSGNLLGTANALSSDGARPMQGGSMMIPRVKWEISEFDAFMGRLSDGKMR